jgi:predicted polyphosphate/ATP-dependent NAD kinase
MPTSPLLALGVLINPIAGMGGKVGLHGTDKGLIDEALIRGAQGTSVDRARRALEILMARKGEIKFYSPTGKMGGELLESLGIEFIPLEITALSKTSADDTISAARAMLDLGVDAIIFAGGDGTARDIFSAVGNSIPIVGIPSGVKMRSGIFAHYPEQAGEIILDVLNAVLTRGRFEICDAEILDLSEQSLEYSSSEYFGSAITFRVPTKIMSPKITSSAHYDSALEELASSLGKSLESDRLYLFGPGKSAKMILISSGITRTQTSFAGVDAYLNGKIVGEDLDEKSILSLLHQGLGTKDPILYLGVIGGQGFLLGRGNQQLSLEVMSQIGSENTFILASAQKINQIVPSRLYVDLGESSKSHVFPEYVQVHVANNRTLVCKVISSAASF